MHLFHKWGKWEVGEADWRKPSGRVYTTVIQFRDCDKCGKLKIRKP